MLVFPAQRISHKKKIKNNFEWAKKCADYIASHAWRSREEYESSRSNYDLYFSKVNQRDFQRECNPFGVTLPDSPDEIKPYNKVFTKVQVLLGELLSRPTAHRVVTIDRNSISEKLLEKQKMLFDFLYGNSEVDPAQIEAFFSKTYRDSREIIASKLLNYYRRLLDLSSTELEGFRHSLINGYEIYYLSHDGKDPVVNVVHPLDFYYMPSDDSPRIEDASWAVWRTYHSLSSILDMYSDKLTEEEVSELQETYHLTDLQHDFSTIRYDDIDKPNYNSSSVDFICVEKIEWVSDREVFFVTTVFEDGTTEEDVVTDLYIPKSAFKRKDEDTKEIYYEFSFDTIQYRVTKKYVKEIWQCTRIANKYYVDIGPRTLSITGTDPLDEKLSFFGLAYTFGSYKPVSLVERMKPFQYLYLIVMHKLKKLIAQDFGRVFPFDVTMVDPKIGLEKTIYFLRELGLDIYNPLQNTDQPGWSQRGKVTSAIDLSNAQHIVNYLQILAILDQQIGEVAGINRQREGYIQTQEAVTNAQTNATLSSVVTLSIFYAHDKLWERLLTALINIAKQTNSSLYTQTILNDEESLILALESFDTLKDAHIGVFITSSPSDKLLFDSIQQASTVLFNAKQMSIGDYIAVMSASSVAEIKQRALEIEQRGQQAVQEQVQAQAEAQKDAAIFEHELEMEKERLKSETALEVARINSFRFQNNQDINSDSVPDQLQIEQLRYDADYRKKKLELEEKRLEIEKEKVEKQNSNS